MAGSLLIDFRDVGGNALLLDPATMDVDALIGQLSSRIGEPHNDVADASVSLPVDVEAIRATADQLALVVPLTEPIVVDRDTVERRLLEKHILSHTYSRSNPPRGVFSVRLGIDLRGGVEFLCRLYDRQGVAQPATDEEVTILRERLDARGLTEPQISRLSNGDIQVVIPGGTEADAAQTRNLIENTGNLEVREIKAEICDGHRRPKVRFDTNGVNPRTGPSVLRCR